ncbi:DUF3445 domain-containing protein [Spirosoma terrae]|uniref:DUF3445 domain-containing protein n=1 Tax=Spirosoma terrae TaxID=1968276 RepID=A0A6L9LDT9_9BACT|nr:DUF3445 domain-containing protein [Spirosoma terrae]NDU97321.1 DUF3445 domain-containing protein [Spirosoma terrae]
MLPYFPFGQQFNDKMGTMPLTNRDRFIDVDDHYQSEVALKRQLLQELPAYYFQSAPVQDLAQWEVVDLILNNLASAYPDTFRLQCEGDQWLWQNSLLNEETSFTFGDSATLPYAPLDWVGRQLQEDLLLLSGDSANLVAGQLCFGNGWSLDEKMGLPFWEIHAPINPIVEPMMRSAQKLMERLPAGKPIWRLNWSIKASDQLDMTSRHTPALNQHLNDCLPDINAENAGDHLFIRIERQILSRLRESKAILFSIHTYQNLVSRERSERPQSASLISQVLRTTPEAMLAYKGITPYFNHLINYLNTGTITN